MITASRPRSLIAYSVSAIAKSNVLQRRGGDADKLIRITPQNSCDGPIKRSTDTGTHGAVDVIIKRERYWESAPAYQIHLGPWHRSLAPDPDPTLNGLFLAMA